MDEEHVAEGAYRFLRGNTTGDLRFEEHFRTLRYVIGPDGRVVAPVMVAMVQAVDTVLFVPEVIENAMEVQVTLEEFDADGPHGALTDRWRIYHGDPEDTHWAFFDIDSIRFEAMVIDGETMRRPNSLAEHEPRLCREINQNRTEDLFRICNTVAGVDVEKPVLVGIDPLGFDVRRRFDVARIESPGPMESAEAAEFVFNELSQEAAATE